MGQNIESRIADVSLSDITKIKIVGATERLLETRDLEHVSVKDICSEANISRQTFYKHFESKHSIAEWRWGIIAEKYIPQMGRTLTVAEATLAMLDESSHYARLLYSDDISYDYEKLLSWATRKNIDYVRSTVTDYLKLELTPELDFQIRFYLEEAGRIIYLDGRKRAHKNRVRLAEMLAACLPAKLAEVLSCKGEAR